jgi:predicted Zn-dependent protease
MENTTRTQKSATQTPQQTGRRSPALQAVRSRRERDHVAREWEQQGHEWKAEGRKHISPGPGQQEKGYGHAQQGYEWEQPDKGRQQPHAKKLPRPRRAPRAHPATPT